MSIARRTRIMFAVVAVATMTLAACGSSGGTESGSAPGSAAGSASGTSGSSGSVKTSGATGSPIVVGVVEPYTGTEAYYGKWQDDGWAFAMDKYGSSVDGHPIKLIKGDSKCDPSTAVSVTRKILVQKPTVINAPNCSADTLALLPITTAAKIPVVSENVAAQVSGTGSSYIWVAQTNDDATNKVFGAYIAAQGYHKIGVIHDTTAYGVANAASLVAALKAHGTPPVSEATYELTATDYSGQILQLKQAGVDAAYFEGYDLQIGNLVKQAKSLGLNVPIYGPTTASDDTFLKAAGSAAPDITFATAFIGDWSKDASTFSTQWQKRFGYPPNMSSVGMYQVAVVTIKALQQAGADASPSDVNVALGKLKVGGLPEGAVSFTSTGEIAKPTVLVGTWKDKKPVLVKVLTKP